MAPKKIPVRRTGRALAHLHSKPSPHTRLVPHFAGTLRSPQIEMRSAHGWRQPELHFGEARTRFPASHEPPGGASREPCAHLRSKCASRMGGGSEFEKPVSIAKNNTSRPYPKPTSALWMPTITVQISPPRKLSGVCETSDQISAKWSFQLESAFSRVDTTQLSLT